MSKTERVGVSLDKKLLLMFDRSIAKQGYANRSEAIRDLIRNRLSEEHLADPTSQATAGVFLIYDH
ncbi:MAG: ribbon-helix-helix protein, CopG family, partial [Planctomycetes bacterium]|nr:ribbon-helix-helix protein, CopG family [Planctomycetota bacterium]